MMMMMTCVMLRGSWGVELRGGWGGGVGDREGVRWDGGGRRLQL